LAQVLGNTQRKIRVKLDLSDKRFSPRKLFPVNPKTLGDYLIVKRYEADLSQAEVAAKLRGSDKTLRAWEYDQAVPSGSQLRTLSQILPLNLAGIEPKPNISI
jgi:ribosome-binding protein aMBF1 (putative translation factor)